MAVVGDFVVIENEPVTIGDNGNGVTTYNKDFGTGGRDSKHGAYLSLMVTGMNINNAAEAQVRINNKIIGNLSRYPLANENEWQNQTFTFAGSVLNSGNNRLTIFGSPISNGGLDDFTVRSIVCHFYQNV